MKTFVALVVVSIGCVFAAAACGSGAAGSAKDPSGPETEATDDAGAPHYALERTSFALRLSAPPATRFRCSVEFNGEQQTVEWDPSSSEGLARFVRFTGTAATTNVASTDAALAADNPLDAGVAADLDPDASVVESPSVASPAGSSQAPYVRCGSEIYSQSGDGGVQVGYQYVSEGNAALDKLCVSSSKPHKFKLKAVVGSGTGTEVELTCVKTDRKLELADLLGQDTPIARTRSLDPLTPVLTDLAVTSAAIAIDKAKSNGARLINRILQRQLCEQLTERRFHGYRFAQQIGLRDTDEPLFPRTCELVRTTSVEVLAAVPRMLSQTLANDLAHILLKALRNGALSLPPEVRLAIVPMVESATLAAIEGRAILTERDSQVLMLQIAQVGLCRGADQLRASPRTCRARLAIEAGVLLVAECVKGGSCTADELQRRILREANKGTKELAKALREIPELLPVLARTVDVFQPPPGTPAKATAKVALNTAVDILIMLARSLQADAVAAAKNRLQNQSLEEIVTEACETHVSNAQWVSAKACTEEKKGGREAHAALTSHAAAPALLYLETLRELVNAVSDEEPERAARAAASFLVKVIGDEESRCEKDDSCDSLYVSPEGVRRTFGVVNALLAYASSYRDAPEGSDATGRAELERLQTEERKEAMNQLIDAATDRSDRGGTWVVSLGTGVALSHGWFDPRQGSDRKGYGLSLPTGLAVEFLPKHVLGFHAQAVAFDLSQYAVAPEGDDIEPEATSAIFPGVRAGVLLGESDIAGVLGAGIGYAPRARFTDGAEKGMLRVEVFAGVYVPFFDLN